MKYKTEKTATDVSSQIKQEFSDFIDDFQLLLREDKLVKSETPINRQELIQSSKDTALEKALEKFLPQGNITDDPTIVDYAQTNCDLDFLMQAHNVANDYKKKFNLPDDFNTSQVYDFVSRQNTLLKDYIKNKSTQPKEVSNNEVKTQTPSQESK